MELRVRLRFVDNSVVLAAATSSSSILASSCAANSIQPSSSSESKSITGSWRRPETEPEGRWDGGGQGRTAGRRRPGAADGSAAAWCRRRVDDVKGSRSTVVEILKRRRATGAWRRGRVGNFGVKERAGRFPIPLRLACVPSQLGPTAQYRFALFDEELLLRSAAASNAPLSRKRRRRRTHMQKSRRTQGIFKSTLY